MASSTALYAITGDGLAIYNKPGTLPEWLPPRRVALPHMVRAVWAEPGPPIRVLAATEGGLLLSETGGRAWQPVGPDGVGAWVIAPGTQDAGHDSEHSPLYAALDGGALWLSEDGGVTWRALPPLPAHATGRALSMEEERGSAGRFYLLVATQDGGATSILTGDPRRGDWSALGDLSLSAPPTDIAQGAAPGFLYGLTSGGVALSETAGTAWTLLDGSPAEGRSLLSLPGPEGAMPALVVGLDGGRIAVSPDGGAKWAEQTLPQGGAVVALARDPERRDRLYAATADGYLYESGNRGVAWQPVNRDPAGEVSGLFVVRI